MSNFDLLKANCFDQVAVERRNLLNMPSSEQGTSSPWVISPPCSGVSEFARTVRTRSGETG
eukprot:11432280-Prorocentrum_lima.AAC.1